MVLWVALLLAAVGGIGYVGYPVLEARIFKTEVAVTEISTVSPAQAAITVTSTGYVVPQKISRVGAKLPGRVAKVLIKEGSVVKAGDTLVLLEATDQQSSIAVAGARASAAQARVETAQANLADLRQQLERERSLFEKGAIGKAAVDDLAAKTKSSEQAVKAAQAEARSAQAEINPLRVSLHDYTITSPIDGTVISKPVEAGELVGVQSNTIAEIADFNSMVVGDRCPRGSALSHQAR